MELQWNLDNILFVCVVVLTELLCSLNLAFVLNGLNQKSLSKCPHICCEVGEGWLLSEGSNQTSLYFQGLGCVYLTSYTLCNRDLGTIF